LIYLTITILDLAYAVQVLSQFMDKPRRSLLMYYIEYYATSRSLQDKEFSYLPQATFNYMHYVMQIEHDVETLDVQSLEIVNSLESHQYLGKRISKQ
jgi:Ser/Thr protein kinase RdoA (MazF antagonist)